MGLVVGATGGIGGACAEALASSVDQLVLTGRNDARLATIASRVGQVARPVVADLAHADGRAAIVGAVRKLGEPLRWAVIASGAPLRGPLAALDEADIVATFQSNLIGPALLLRALGDMKWTASASLVIIGSISASRALRDRSVYAASKAGLERLAISLAAEWAPRGIRVSVVAPGVIATPFLGSDHARLDKWTKERVPSGRAGTPAEVANVVKYVALEAPDYLIGARLVVDGGTEAVA